MNATKQPKVHIGSITTGTLLPEDLLEAFSDELRRLDANGHYAKLLAEAAEILESNIGEYGLEDTSGLVDDLQYALQEFAPPYTYFGAHPGDGADFGFWPDHDSLEDAIHDGEKLDDGDVLTDDGLVISVSGHGNVTVFDQNRNELWSCV